MKKRKLIIWMSVILVAGAAVFILYKFLFAAADGTITTPASKTSTPTATTQRQTISDEFASFSYPSEFTRLQTEAINAPVLQRYNLIRHQFGSWQIAIQITHLPSGSLDDDGSYHYRNVTPDRFTREERTIGKHQTVVFTDKTSDSFSKVAFLHNNDRSASISLSGGTAKADDELQTEFDKLVASWQWH